MPRELIVRIRGHLLWEPHNGCWLWQGAMHPDGRPMVQADDGQVNVRRLLYDIKYGPLSERDHLAACPVAERCCKPDHQRVVKRGPVVGTMGSFETWRFDVCSKGHALTPDNAYVYEGKKLCRLCRAVAERNYRLRAKSAGPRNPSGAGRRPSWP